jgi:hypothetical protein
LSIGLTPSARCRASRSRPANSPPGSGSRSGETSSPPLWLLRWWCEREDGEGTPALLGVCCSLLVPPQFEVAAAAAAVAAARAAAAAGSARDEAA